MGAVGGLLGLNGGAGGTGFSGPQQANINPGVNQGQLQTAYGGAQNSLASQQALLQALQAQNGLGNQSSVFNQLQGVANGTGPNPAQAQLAQATGANTANQAALMAGQRGAGANAGLIARQAAQQGGANQQNAVGQAATMQANQSLNALGQLGGLANQQVSNQIGATTANTQAQQAEQQQLLQAQAAANNAAVGSQSSINQANSGLAQTSMGGQQALIGGGLKAAGSAFGAAQGGMIPSYADGGMAGAPTPAPPAPSGPQSTLGKFLSGWGNSTTGQDNSGSPQQTDQGPGTTPGQKSLYQGADSLGTGIAKYMKKPAAPATSVVAGPDAADLGVAEMVAAHGGNVGSKLKQGGHVPGKAAVSGNSYQNDTVKALLSPGEVVIPRDVINSKDPVAGAAKFVAAVMAKKRAGK